MTSQVPCYRHPRITTAVTCSICTNPICPDCMVFRPTGIQCPDCAGLPPPRVRRLFFRGTRSKLEAQRFELAAKERRLAWLEKELHDAAAARDAEITAEAERRAAALDAERRDLDSRQARLDILLRSRVDAHHHIAAAWADWEIVTSKREAEYLRKKKRPAVTAAELVKEKGRVLADLRRRLKVAEFTVAFYEQHFPWLADLRDIEADLDYAESAPDPENREDPAARFLSADEYRSLSTADRNQRALDRYLRSHMTPWQLGRDYERYVGYLRESDGCKVEYHGILKGFEDLGRDVIAERDGVIEVIQCKRWAQHKTIHEKHVFQLFGTMTAARIENPGKMVTGTFVTTTTLSDRAREFARALDIKVEEGFPLADYPRIKCNIARRTREAIYHLPFDQQYDTTVIEPERGECYVSTCIEAEQLGFRRAWRWQGATD